VEFGGCYTAKCTYQTTIRTQSQHSQTQRTYFVLRCEWNLPGTRTMLEINMWQTNKHNRWFWGTVPNHKIAQSLSKQNNGKANCLHKAERGSARAHTHTHTHIYTQTHTHTHVLKDIARCVVRNIPKCDQRQGD